YVAPASIAVPQPVVVVAPAQPNRDEIRDNERVPPPRPAEAPVAAEPMALGAPASVFRPIRPEDRVRVTAPRPTDVTKPAPPATPPKLERHPRGPPPREPPPLPGPPATAAEPKTASAQQIQSGKEAFQARQYGRAERSFRRATERLPDDPLAPFLLAQ